MKARLQEMEDEANKLKEMQAQAEEEMNGGGGGGSAEATANREEADARSVHVGGVDYATTPEELQQHFAACGTVNRVTILTDRYENPKGFAYVEFLEVDAVQSAIALTDTEANLRALVQKVRAAGARPLLMGMNVPTNLGEYAEEFAALFPRIAGDLDVPLVPRFLEGVGGVPEMNLPDGLHPTREGHEQLAANVRSALGSELTALRGR